MSKQELLAIVETLKEFKGILWGKQLMVYTDHKNKCRMLFLTSDQVYCWRLLLEEYGTVMVSIKGIHNTVADAISRLDMDPSQMTGQPGRLLPNVGVTITQHKSIVDPLATSRNP